MANILFIGRFYLRQNYNNVVQNSTNFIIDNAGNNLQWNYIKGFIENGVSVKAYTFPVLSPKIVLSKRMHEIYLKNAIVIKPCIFNIHLVKQLNEFIYTFILLLFKNRDNRPVVVYSYYLPIVFAAVLAKAFPLRKFTINLIIPDLPIYQSSSTLKIYRLLKTFENFILNKVVVFVNNFALITDNLNSVIPGIKKNNSVVIEGILDSSVLKFSLPKLFNRITFLYSGTLDPRYGVLDLLKAFMRIRNENIRLVILGEGPCKSEFITASRTDHRIYYFGNVSYQRALWFQRRSTFLVNPRSDSLEYTKYSFPSKTLDYLGCLRPILGFRLSGMPKEYFPYIFSIEQIKFRVDDYTTLEEILYTLLLYQIENNFNSAYSSNDLQLFLATKSPKNQTMKFLNLILNEK